VIDVEATCWQGRGPAGEEPEIIEIGNAILRTAGLRVEPGPEILVRLAAVEKCGGGAGRI
jgi:hypothetical protein